RARCAPRRSRPTAATPSRRSAWTRGMPRRAAATVSGLGSAWLRSDPVVQARTGPRRPRRFRRRAARGRPIRPLQRGSGRAERGLHPRDDRRERRLVGDREVGEHLAVEADRSTVQAVDEHAVRDAVLAHRRVDPRDPQRAEYALLGTPVAIRVLAGPHDRLLGNAKDVSAPSAVTLGRRNDLLVARSRRDSTFDSGHGALLMRTAAWP